MKTFLRNLAPFVILGCYCIIAGGSLEDIGISVGITLGILAVVGIIWAIVASVNESKTREEGLAKAKDQFGDYTKSTEYKLGKYILFDEPSNRILLKDTIMDSRKIRDIKVVEIAPKTTTTYIEEQVTKTSTGSALGRGVAGALIAGPVGAVIGGTTAKQKTETKKTPVHHTTPGRYSIDVIDDAGNVRAHFFTNDLEYHNNVKYFIKGIIDENTKGERLALEQAKEYNEQRLINSKVEDIAIGASVEAIQSILIDSQAEDIEDGSRYVLCPKAVTVINQGLNVNFEKISILAKNQIVTKLSGLSPSFTAGNFKNLLLEISALANTINEKIGAPSKTAAEISYTSLTDDNNLINAYNWDMENKPLTKIDVVCDKGKYKYLFTTESK